MKKLWNRDFILLLQGNAISALGDILYSVAIGYWVFEKTGSNALMGIMSSISLFVVMFVSPFSGSLIDKMDRKNIIVIMDIIRGIIMLVAGYLAYNDTLSVEIVLLCAFLASMCSVFFSPSVQTVMIDIIPSEDMVQGQSVFNSINSLISLVGKAISGALVAYFGVGIIIILNGISYLLSAFTEVFIKIPRSVQQGNKVTISSMLNDLLTGMKAIVGDRFLRMFVSFALLINFLCYGPITLMLPFVLNKGFSIDYYGFLMAIETCGSLLCVLGLSVIKLSPRQRYFLMTFGFISFDAIYLFAYLSNDMIFMAIAFFVACFMNTLGNSIFNASMMLALPDTNRGAILGFIQSSSMGGCAISSVVFGVLCDIFIMKYVFVAGLIVSFIPMCYFCFNSATKEFIESH